MLTAGLCWLLVLWFRSSSPTLPWHGSWVTYASAASRRLPSTALSSEGWCWRSLRDWRGELSGAAGETGLIDDPTFTRILARPATDPDSDSTPPPETNRTRGTPEAVPGSSLNRDLNALLSRAACLGLT